MFLLLCSGFYNNYQELERRGFNSRSHDDSASYWEYDCGQVNFPLRIPRPVLCPEKETTEALLVDITGSFCFAAFSIPLGSTESIHGTYR